MSFFPYEGTFGTINEKKISMRKEINNLYMIHEYIFF